MGLGAAFYNFFLSRSVLSPSAVISDIFRISSQISSNSSTCRKIDPVRSQPLMDRVLFLGFWVVIEKLVKSIERRGIYEHPFILIFSRFRHQFEHFNLDWKHCHFGYDFGYFRGLNALPKFGIFAWNSAINSGAFLHLKNISITSSHISTFIPVFGVSVEFSFPIWQRAYFWI